MKKKLESPASDKGNFINSIKQKVTNSQGNYLNLYTTMIFTRLLLTSGLPVIIFFINSYNFEMHTNARLTLLNYNEKYKNDTSYIKYYDGYWIKTDSTKFNKDLCENPDSICNAIPCADNGKHDCNNHSRVDSAALTLIKSLRTYQNDVSNLEYYLDERRDYDSTNRFNNIFCRNVQLMVKHDSKCLNCTILRSIDSLNYKIPNINSKNSSYRNSAFAFWILLIIGMIALWNIINFSIVKLFGTFIKELSELENLDTRLLGDGHSNLLYLQGLPGSGKMEAIKEFLIKKNKSNPYIFIEDFEKFKTIARNDKDIYVAVIDLMRIPDSTEIEHKNLDEWENYTNEIIHIHKPDYIIVDHFDYNNRDRNTNLIKLNLLERLLFEKRGHIVIVSTIDVSDFIISLKDFDQLDDDDSKKLDEDIFRWRALLAQFTNLNISIDENSDIIEQQFQNITTLNDLIEFECRRINFLQKLKQAIKNTIHESKEISSDNPLAFKDDIIIKIQNLAHQYYQSLWNSLTMQEKLIVLDLAEDNLINSNNYYYLKSLREKGVIHYNDGQLKLFNYSFRNFILSQINDQEIQ